MHLPLSVLYEEEDEDEDEEEEEDDEATVAVPPLAFALPLSLPLDILAAISASASPVSTATASAESTTSSIDRLAAPLRTNLAPPLLPPPPSVDEDDEAVAAAIDFFFRSISCFRKSIFQISVHDPLDPFPNQRPKLKAAINILQNIELLDSRTPGTADSGGQFRPSSASHCIQT